LRRARRFALCLYKPTLLVLIPPMLIAGRQWKTAIGFLWGAAVLAIASVLLFGLSVCRHFISVLKRLCAPIFTGPSVFRMWKYVDLASFVNLLQGGQTKIGLILVAAVLGNRTVPSRSGLVAMQARRG